jgi:hypothetical protein
MSCGCDEVNPNASMRPHCTFQQSLGVVTMNDDDRKRLYARVRQIIRDSRAQPADVVVISQSGNSVYLEESTGKWLNVNFEREIRVDRNTHMRTGEKHAHIHDRQGNEMYALTHDSKPSHGSQPFKLDRKQADALRNQGFTIKPNRVVEAVLIGRNRMIIYG